MNRSLGPLAVAFLVAGMAAGPALAASTALDQYPTAEQQIRDYFRQNFGQSSSNCGAGQINDITITTPVFKQDRLVALFANTCHSADIGGRILSAEAREVFEEGLRIPIMKLFDRGEPNRILMQIVRTNVRQTDEVIGDFYAQTACNDAGGRALLEMMEEFELNSIDPVADEIIRRS